MSLASWEERFIFVEPFPRNPFDFEKICDFLADNVEGLSSCNGVLEVTTGMSLRELADLFKIHGVEASRMYERVEWTVMETSDNFPGASDPENVVPPQ